jgi:hypothetical protein
VNRKVVMASLRARLARYSARDIRVSVVRVFETEGGVI